MSTIAHRGMQATVVSTVFTALAIVAVCFRMYTRVFVVRFVGVEDYLSMCSTLFSAGVAACIAVQAEYGLGHHITDLNPAETRKMLKAFWVSLSCYYLSLTFTKTSILLQYKRVFISKTFQIVCCITIVICLLYGTWTILGSIFACRPVEAFWTRDPKAKCFNQEIMWFANAGLNIVTDFVIIIIPMPVVQQLQMPRRQRHALIAVFAFGGFVCLVSILRLQSLIAISNSTDPTYTNVDAATWTSVEINVGIICSCLPALRPLISRRFPGLFTRITNDTDNSARTSTLVQSTQSSMPPVLMKSGKGKKSYSTHSDEENLAGAIEVVTELDIHVEDDDIVEKCRCDLQNRF